jgi:hypothetical protein
MEVGGGGDGGTWAALLAACGTAMRGSGKRGPGDARASDAGVGAAAGVEVQFRVVGEPLGRAARRQGLRRRRRRVSRADAGPVDL